MRKKFAWQTSFSSEIEFVLKQYTVDFQSEIEFVLKQYTVDFQMLFMQ